MRRLVRFGSTIGIRKEDAADLKRAVAFYEKVIGWKATPSPSEIAFFDLAGVVFSLYSPAFNALLSHGAVPS